ncbi:MAG: chromosomal replication initiator protein DnaA [Caldithrix sp.]|nr:chromosomal replication initiator protein DnaA [Caldithrix sp.]
MSTAPPEISTETQTIWESVLGIIKENINIRSYNTWFAPIDILNIDSDYMELQVPNQFFSEWIENHYAKLLKNAVTQTLGESRKIKYYVEDGPLNNTSPYEETEHQENTVHLNAPSKSNYTSSPFYTRINERYLFDNFVIGDNNRFAVAASRAIADNLGKSHYNPLIIYGGTGLGKTHLIQAIGNSVLQKAPGTTVYYASSETFTSHFINAIQQNNVSNFSQFYRSCDLLLLDDIHFFSNKGKTQEEFFHTFNDLHQNGKHIVLTSDRPINELEALEERLISRFKWGLVVDIQPPDYETRLAILRNKCDESELDIPGDVLEYLAVNLEDNVRELEGALTKILAQVTFTAAEPTLNLARQIVKEIAKPDKQFLNIDTIMEHVASHYGLSPDRLRAKIRKKDIVIARQVAMYLSKELTKHTLVTIGLHFGGRDHATVLHSIEKVIKTMQEDDAFKQRVNAMKKHLSYNR